jgi:predicted nucleotide-binding protein
MTIDLMQIRTSKQRFYDIQSDMMRSKYHNIGNNLNAFVEFGEKDAVMSEITQPLKENKNVDVKKWYDDIFKTGGSFVGSKRYVLPSDPYQEASILYQFVLCIHSGKLSFDNFTIGVYGTTRYDDAVYEFVNDIFTKLFRYLSRSLDTLEADYVSKIRTTPVVAKTEETRMPNQVFLVHGHDKEMLTSVELLIRQVGLEPIILSDERNEGLTIIEKFEKHSNVRHAIILLSPDDKGCKAEEFPDGAIFRARQNVILEMGFFTGRLGRKGVTVLHKQADNFEMPSDYHGVSFVPFDKGNTWKYKLTKELEGAGFKVDYSHIS